MPATLDAAFAHHRAGRLDEAAAAYERVLAVDPGNVDAHYNLGNLRDAQGRIDDAIACYRRAIEIKPDYAAALCNLGTALKALGRIDDALIAYQHAAAAQADLFEAHYNLAIACRDLRRTDEAIASFRRALALRPGSAEVHYGLGHTLREEDRLDEARACFREALALDPDHVEARWSVAMSHLPSVYAAGDDPEAFRRRFVAELGELESWFNPARSARGHAAVGADQPFALAYQEEDNRELLRRHGELCARLMAQWQRSRGPAPIATGRGSGPVRVAIVSAHFRSHSVWNALMRGWFQRLDPRRVALYAFDLGAGEDAQTRYARSRAAGFEAGPRDLEQWVDAITASRPDVVLYPEVGMEPMAARLASLRLAPVQAATWGHPETTGLPTIDCYLSAERLEPPGAPAHYTERLVTLPNLGCFVEPDPIAPRHPDFEQLGLDPRLPLLICPGVPFKYAPRDDRTFAEIAQRLGRCRFVFFRFWKNGLSERLEQRLQGAFAARGLDYASFVRFIPWQSPAAFRGLLERADVFLDTIGFSGFNTALQGIECGLPVVTREGRFLRGRLASGILRHLEMDDLVAETESAYVDTAVRLVQDADYSEEVAERMAAARPRIYEDAEPMRALEEFLVRAAAGAA